MDRRGFLRLLGGAAVTAVAAPAVIHVLPPLGGWRQGQSGLLYASNGYGGSNWAHKTPAEILADVNAMLAETWERSSELEWPNFIGSAAAIKVLAYTPCGSKSMLTVQNRRVTDVQLYGV